jgi:hypothetical protein
LIEERLKQMEVTFIHQRYLHGRSPESLGSEQASEPAAENKHAVVRHAKRIHTKI